MRTHTRGPPPPSKTDLHLKKTSASLRLFPSKTNSYKTYLCISLASCTLGSDTNDEICHFCDIFKSNQREQLPHTPVLLGAESCSESSGRTATFHFGGNLTPGRISEFSIFQYLVAHRGRFRCAVRFSVQNDTFLPIFRR